MTLFFCALLCQIGILAHVFLTAFVLSHLSITQKNYFMQSSCSGSPTTFQGAVSFDKSLGELVKRTPCQQFSCPSGREWSFSLETMEVNAGSSGPKVKQPLDCSISVNEGNNPVGKEVGHSLFINHAAIAWHASRRKWIGDQSQRQQRMTKDPIISWSTTYEELLSTSEPFSEPIPLAEMVDFLVDIWYDEGLFD